MKKSRRIASLGIALAVGVTLAGFSLAGRRAPRSVDVRTTDSNITKLATDILGHSQFAHHPLDAELAGRLLDRYLDALDGTHSLFLKSDIEQFASYRADLAKATLASGDTTAAYAIFARYLQRLKDQVSFCKETLRTSKFAFSAHDSYSFDREHAPPPIDATAARALWRAQLRAEYLQEKLNDKPAAQIVATLSRRREQQLATMQGLHDDEILEIYLDSLAHIYDPHSDYLGHEQMESFSISMNLSLFGIGAALETEDGYCKIRELLPGGPAARSGLLKPGDRIVAVAQAGQEPVDIMNMPLGRAVELIRGPKGSSVTLTILPGGVAEGSIEKTVSLVRDQIKLEDQAAKARILDLPAADKGKAPLRLGVIDLPSFYADMGDGQAGPRRSATVDVARLLTKLKAEHVAGVVMDVRRNGGGSLAEAVSLTGLFIRRGPVVQTRDASGRIEVAADNDGDVTYDGPLVLLSSRLSASATEILAGALQDYGRAVVVGDSSTFGKGTVQSILELAPLMDRSGLPHSYDPGALKITISKFYRPSGASTQLRGVASDIVLPSATDFADISETTLKDPLPWDVVPAAPYDRLDRVRAYLDALRGRSVGRRKGSKAFAYLEADINRLAKSLATKAVSLNEAERRAEMAETKARHQQERELLAASADRPTSYAITLGNVDTRGLPPPSAPSGKDDSAAAASGAAVGGAEDGDITPMRGGPGDLVLQEGVRILADYVALLAAHDAGKPLGSAAF